MPKGSRLPAYLAIIALIAAGTAAASTSGALVRTGKTGLGRVLVDSHGRTLYLFQKDKPGRSACNGTCADFWPPLVTAAKARAGSGARAAMLGTIKRADGRLQVTYNGHPLYTFKLDTKAGQTRGEALTEFGATWYAVSANGSKVKPAASGGGSGGGGYGGRGGYGGG